MFPSPKQDLDKNNEYFIPPPVFFSLSAPAFIPPKTCFGPSTELQSQRQARRLLFLSLSFIAGVGGIH